VRVADLEFVVRADADAGNENFPHARRAEQSHRMKPPVPIIEIPDDADALRVRRPDREARAGDAVGRAQLRAELVENFPLIAFAEQEQIRFAERRQK
jgi:2-polyprenyl-6-methoxyphenol hydroxylase-like FAD-dependent oxidoreductase